MQQNPESDDEERLKEQLVKGVRLTVHLQSSRQETSSTPELPQELPPWWSTALDEAIKLVINPVEELAKLSEATEHAGCASD